MAKAANGKEIPVEKIKIMEIKIVIKDQWHSTFLLSYWLPCLLLLMFCLLVYCFVFCDHRISYKFSKCQADLMKFGIVFKIIKLFNNS